MLRSLFSGISGLRAHQTMLDVTGNNIANVNTTGFKASQVQFQDTLSQMQSAATGPQDGRGGSNPAQVGLGVRTAGITTNFTQGAASITGRSTDMMISGEGFFTVSKNGTECYTRAGNFDFDAQGNLITPDGGLVLGWPAANGVVNAAGPTAPIKLPLGAAMGAKATDGATFGGNLPADAATGTALARQIKVYDAAGNPRDLTLTFTKSETAWTLDASDGQTSLLGEEVTFDAAGRLTAPAGALTLGGVQIDVSTLTGYAGITSIEAKEQDGRQAGKLEAFELQPDGTLMGSFSNGQRYALAQLGLATFANPAGLEKSGSSVYRATVNSGQATVGAAGEGGRGELSSGALEMSNVDLSAEFTSLIVAQRGFQANSRVITTSDELLQELVNLKR